MRPDFIIAGAARSGTTWAYELLSRHPRIFMAKPRQPEPKFFWDDAAYAKGMDWYLEKWFGGAPEKCVWGEKSTAYLEGAEIVAPRLGKHLPEVKLIFILRDPVERAYSNYLWSKMNGWEKLSFEEAMEKEKDREKNLDTSLKFVRPYSYLSRGFYARLLKPFFDRFAAGNILCLRYEDIKKDAEGFASKLHAFLEVELRPQDAQDLDKVNVSKKPAESLPENLRKKMSGYYARANGELGELLGSGFAVWKEEGVR